jgi:hypothetical protein
MASNSTNAMSVEKLQLLHEDYIRADGAVQALWTFHQFLRGPARPFEVPGTEPASDFNGLTREVKAGGVELGTGTPGPSPVACASSSRA